jgi:hypothetical protein
MNKKCCEAADRTHCGAIKFKAKEGTRQAPFLKKA